MEGTQQAVAQVLDDPAALPAHDRAGLPVMLLQQGQGSLVALLAGVRGEALEVGEDHCQRLGPPARRHRQARGQQLGGAQTQRRQPRRTLLH